MFKNAWDVIRETYADWSGHNAVRLGAALAFYAIFSLSPLLVIAIAIAGFVYGEQAAQGQLMQSIESLVGHTAAQAIQQMLAGVKHSGSGALATVIGVVTLIVVSSGLFAELQSDLDIIWGVSPKPGRSWFAVIKDRFFAFLMVVGAGVVLLAAMIGSAVLTRAADLIGGLPGWGWQMLDWVLTIMVFTLIFAFIFKYLPDVVVAWKDVWVGALVTGVLLAIGKYFIGLYLGWSSVSSAFGAAGSLAILLLWIYYCAQIIFFGAEFAKVYARKFGDGVRPKQSAILVSGN